MRIHLACGDGDHAPSTAEPVEVCNLVSESGLEAPIAGLVASKQVLFSGLFDGTSDEISSGEATSFLAKLEKLVDVPQTPATTISQPAAEDDLDASSEAASEPATPPEVPAAKLAERAESLPGAELGALLAQVRIAPPASATGVRCGRPSPSAPPTFNAGDGTGRPGDDTSAPRDDASTPRDDTSTPRDDASTPGDDTSTPGDATGKAGDAPRTAGDDASIPPAGGVLRRARAAARGGGALGAGARDRLGSRRRVQPGPSTAGQRWVGRGASRAGSTGGSA